jgi:hypothetical protein
MKRGNKLIVITGFAGLFALSASATVYTPISNLGQPALGTFLAVDDTYTPAVSFTTGNEASYLSSISLSEGQFSIQFNLGQSLAVSLYNDSGGDPGSSLTTLSTSFPLNLGFQPTTVVYSDPNFTSLQANTTYWIVEADPFVPLVFSCGWATTDSTDLDDGSSWTLSKTEDYYNNVWNDEPNYCPQFSVQVSDTALVPEPSSFVLAGLGIAGTLLPGFIRRLRMATTKRMNFLRVRLPGGGPRL